MTPCPVALTREMLKDPVDLQIEDPALAAPTISDILRRVPTFPKPLK